MKKILLQSLSLIFCANSFGQIGATAPDFTVTDLNGNEISLYADILDQGLIALVDVSATWCGPCWNLHQSHVLRDLHQTYGAGGSNQLRVVFYEGDPNTTLNDLNGTTGSSQGNWLLDTPYPVVNESPLSLNLNVWAPDGFPTLNVIRPSDKKIVADTWNIYTLNGQIDAIENATGLTLTAASTIAVSNTNAISTYPNPANEQLYIEWDNFSINSKIELFTIDGKLIQTINPNAPILTVDTQTLPTGQYVLKVINEDEVSTKMISVVH
jgi:hypothetical protein